MATRKGKIIAVNDHGTVVQFLLREGENTTVATGDGNLTRRMIHQAFQGRHPVGKCIEYEMEGWGGMKWFRLLDEEVKTDDDPAPAPRRRPRQQQLQRTRGRLPRRRAK